VLNVIIYQTIELQIFVATHPWSSLQVKQLVYLSDWVILRFPSLSQSGWWELFKASKRLPDVLSEKWENMSKKKNHWNLQIFCNISSFILLGYLLHLIDNLNWNHTSNLFIQQLACFGKVYMKLYWRFHQTNKLVWYWSNSASAQFMTPQTMQVWLSKMVLAKQFCLIPAREECNKYDDLTGSPCFWLANHNDWPRWFAISSLSLICSPSFSFVGPLQKIIYLNLDGRNIGVGHTMSTTLTEHYWGFS
jgi:hypothetical protein